MKRKGYAVFKCFTVELDDQTWECELTCNKFLSWVFDLFISPFWDGRIYIEEAKKL